MVNKTLSDRLGLKDVMVTRTCNFTLSLAFSNYCKIHKYSKNLHVDCHHISYNVYNF